MQRPNIFVRLAWSVLVFFRFLFDGRFGALVLAAWRGEARPGALSPAHAETPAVAPAPVAAKAPDSAPALHLLAILQREGRLVDFLREDISGFADADVGAAARVVHDGCQRVLSDYLPLEPIRPEAEGARVTLPPGFDPAAVRLTGNVAGQPPFSGALRHHGWRVSAVRLPAPPANVDPAIVAPAEVEL